MASNAYTITSKRYLIQYLHQCLFFPPQNTLLKAISNNQFPNLPGLTYAEVRKNIPNTVPATEKVHMKRQRQGIVSTKEKVNTNLDQIEYEQDTSPPIVKEKQNQLFFINKSLTKK